MSVNLRKSATPATILARNSWTREVFRATLTVPSPTASTPRASTAWTFHIVATPEALTRPYSAAANRALQLSQLAQEMSR